MTATLVVRLSKKELARIDAEARKESLTRSAYVRKKLHLNGANGARKAKAKSGGVGNSGISDSAAMAGFPPTPPGEGVGWREHFKWLRKHGRKVRGNIEDEIRELDRNRGFR
jgi:hypothetical protein